ncbi:MAG: Arm DNA-binding domain-containing protein [Rugosibacter sp.]
MARNELNFTKENIVALPLPEAGKRDEYYDTKVQGLQIRITAAGVKTFYVYRWVRAEGKAERIMLGRFPDMTIENARKAATKVNGAIAEGHNPAAALRGKRAELTLGELFIEYMDRHVSVQCKPRVIKETPELFQRFLGELPLKNGNANLTARAVPNTRPVSIGKIVPYQASRLAT